MPPVHSREVNLARFKKEERKIELFYFLANSWQERAFAAQKKLDVPEACPSPELDRPDHIDFSMS
jgi:hypothetical protein